MTPFARNLLEGHIKALREIAGTLRKENKAYSNNIALELENRADEEEVYLILDSRKGLLI